MSSRRRVADLSTHVPSCLVFDPLQKSTFGDPRELERWFQGHRGEFISAGYITTQINPMLASISEFVEKATESTAPACSIKTFWTDVMRVTIIVDSQDDDPAKGRTLMLGYIGVRPCFEGNGMLSIIVFQLLMTALYIGDTIITKVLVAECVPKTVDILRHKFGSLVTVGEGETPHVYFNDLERAADIVTADMLGIDLKIKSYEYFGILGLRPRAFPSAAKLNDPEWVEANVCRHLRGLPTPRPPSPLSTSYMHQ